MDAEKRRKDAYKKVRAHEARGMDDPVLVPAHPPPRRLPQAIDQDSCRRRRGDATIEIRKQRREESLSKRRNISEEPTPQRSSSPPCLTELPR
jgi:hypothetical protein